MSDWYRRIDEPLPEANHIGDDYLHNAPNATAAGTCYSSENNQGYDRLGEACQEASEHVCAHGNTHCSLAPKDIAETTVYRTLRFSEVHECRAKDGTYREAEML